MTSFCFSANFCEGVLLSFSIVKKSRVATRDKLPKLQIFLVALFMHVPLRVLFWAYLLIKAYLSRILDKLNE